MPGAVYSVLSSGEEAYVVEDASFEKLGEDEFLSYSEMRGSDEDYSDVFQDLYMLGVDTVKLEDIF
ncbi:MAG: hypothetical protein ABEJ87_02840 [Candidatus Nanohalobium sp.]